MTSVRAVGLRPTVVATAPLTPTQRLVWASQRLHPGVPLANMCDLIRIDGEVDPRRFVAAVDEVVTASPALRTVIADDGGTDVARVLARVPRSTEVIDVDRTDLDAWVEHRVAVPIDATQCVYDSVLLRHADDDWTWWLDVHHVAIDATGAALVAAAVGEVYASGRPANEVIDVGGGLYTWAASLSDGESPTGSDADVDRTPGTRSRATAGDAWAPYGRRGPRTTEVDRVPLPLDHLDELLEERLGGDYRSLSRELSLVSLATAATAVLAHRVDGRTSLDVGIPLHHRRTPEARTTVGPLMEIHPLRVELDPEATWRETFTSVLSSVIALLRTATPGTGDDRAVEIIVNVTTATYGDLGGFPARRTWVRSGHVDPNHVVRHQLFDRADPADPGRRNLDWELDVNRSLSADGSHEALPDHLGAAVRAALLDPDAPVAAVDLSTPADRAVAATLVPEPEHRALDAPVHDTIRRVLAVDGDRIVIEQGDRQMTAGEFERAVEAVAGHLLARGARPGEPVALSMTRSVEVLVAINAVLRIGSHFVVVDPSDPVARREHVLADSGAKVVLDAPTIAAAIDADTDDSREPTTAEGDVDLDATAYLLYTSGSTGLPKGVPICHRGLADYLDVALERYVDALDHGPDGPVVALHSSLAFDLTITSLFLSFVAGGRVVVLDEDPIDAMRRIVDDDRITFVKATPSHLDLLARLADDPAADGSGGGAEGARLPVRCFVVGGEAFRRPLAERLREIAPAATIVNEYGPTEAVVGCMIHVWDPARDTGPDVPIGAAMPGCELAVLDAAGRPAPSGTWGELFVRRPGMADRYHERPGLTSERFVHLDPAAVPNPADVVEHDRRRPWYRTGDRVRVERPGVLVYGGRSDDQLKVGGIRLEPAEVEAALVDHPAISGAVVRTFRVEPPAAESIVRCVRCGLGDDVPGIAIDAHGVCSSCRDHERVEPQTRRWFRTPADLEDRRLRARDRAAGGIDALHLLSGGKDSTYALFQLVDRGWRVHALTLDNGFISDGAKENIRRSVADLGITHEFATAPSQEAMNEIFRDSLDRYSNVCQGCYKTIYTLGVARAKELGIPVVVTGLSRGQFFETRLVPHQFEAGRFDPDEIDATVLEARRVYHATSDAVTELLPEQSVFDDASTLDHIEFVDFYRYVDVELADLYRYLEERAPWVRPADTGRSTNCLINVAGIATHRVERGFHNYAEPYAWDVRLGHKTRDEALDELDDEIDAAEVARILDEIGYEPSPPEVLTAWYTLDRSSDRNGHGDRDAGLDVDELRSFLRDRLPDHAIPAAFVRLDEIPLAPSGKADVDALPAPTRVHRSTAGAVQPTTDTERTVAAVWAEVLRLDGVGAADDFFDLGGASLAALDVVARCDAEFGTDLPDAAVFRARTVRDLAAMIDEHLAGGGGADGDDAPASRVPAASTFGGTHAAPATEPLDPTRLSPSQEAMLLDERSSNDPARYVVTWSHRIRSSIDVDALEQAVRDVVAHHAPLHTLFDPGRTTLDRDAAVEWTDLGHVDDIEFDDIAEGERSRAFDLETGPLVRCRAATVDDAGRGTAVRLLMSVHHLAIDASSYDVMWSHIADRLDGRPLPELAISYADAADRPRDPDARDRAARAWLDDATAPDGARSSMAPTGGDEPDDYLHRVLPLTVADLRSTGATTFATALAAAAVVHGTFRGVDDVEIGVPVSTRTDPAAAPLVGYFLNTLPLRVRLGGARSLGEVLGRATDVVVGAIEHRTYPFADIVRDRRSAGFPEPDVSLMLAHEVFTRSSADSLDVEHTVLSSGSAVADATLFLQEHGDDVSIAIEYRGSAVGRARAARMLDLFEATLVALVRRPTVPPDELVSTVAGSDLVGPPLPEHPPTVAQAIAGAIERRPTAVAVVDDGAGELTYAALAARVSILIERIREAADTDRPRVGVITGRDSGLVESTVATWFVGGCYVPLDADTPDDRLAMLASAARLDVAIGSGPRPAALTGVEWIDIDDAIEGFADTTATAPGPESDVGVPSPLASPDDAAYVIFTSGSTGAPRAVEVRHSELAASTAARDVFYDDPPGRFLVTSSPTFDSSLVGLVWPLVSGGTVVVPRDEIVGDVDRLAEVIDRLGVDHVLMVPSLYGALLRRDAGRLRGLRRAIVAGEACPPELVGSHELSLPHVELVDEYGPTEATVWATAVRLDGIGIGSDSAVPIGTPIAGLTARVADRHGRPTPEGTTGELLVSGPTVTGGYPTDPELTRARFVEFDGRRWYRTGDLVVATDGVLRFLGRIDDQLNVGGVRVEPAEIEAAIGAALGIGSGSVAVVAAGDPPQLVAHVATDDHLDIAAVRRRLTDLLPANSIPRRFVCHERLPLTARGKLDRRRLERWSIPSPLAPTTSGRSTDPAGSDAQGHAALAEVVLEVWRRVVEWVDVDADSDYFEIGGDSLTAVELVTAVEDRIGRRVPISVLLSAPSPARMAAALSGAGARTVDGNAPGTDDDRSTPDDGILVVTLRPPADDDRSGPLVLMTPSWDDVFGYQALADSIDEGIEVMALAIAEVGGSSSVTTVSDLVDRTLDRLRGGALGAADRPIVVVGWSVGGVVAVEFGERLAAAGRTVVETVLVDTYFPGQEQHLWSNRWWKYKSMLRPGSLREAAREFVRMGRRRMQRYAARLGRRLVEWSGTSLPHEPERTSIGGFPADAFRHRPTVERVPLFMVCASTTNTERTLERWLELDPGVAHVVVPGRHRGFESIMGDERAHTVAAAIHDRLDVHGLR